MRTWVYTHRYALLSAVLLAFAATVITAPAAFAKEPRHLQIRITNEGIMQGQLGARDGGLYVVTVKNETQGHRGLVMKGIDRAVSPYVRFTKVLAPGHQQTFRWYFPDDRRVRIRDLMSCKHALRSCVVAGIGGMESTLTFG